MESVLRPLLSEKYADKAGGISPSNTEARGFPVRGDHVIIREMRWIVVMGFVTSVAGIAAWNLDNLCCSDLLRWRHQVGLPWGIILEGHGVRKTWQFLYSDS